MAFHVEPPFPPDPNWQPTPHFVSTERFGVVPNFAPKPAPGTTSIPDLSLQGGGPGLGEPLPAEPFGPPDVLCDLEAELALLQKTADFAFWNRLREPAGRKLVARLDEIAALLAPLLAAEPGYRHQALKLLPVPPATRLMALADVRPVVSEALRVVRHLIARRARRG
jgi:hypothetical protein